MVVYKFLSRTGAHDGLRCGHHRRAGLPLRPGRDRAGPGAQSIMIVLLLMIIIVIIFNHYYYCYYYSSSYYYYYYQYMIPGTGPAIVAEPVYMTAPASSVTMPVVQAAPRMYAAPQMMMEPVATQQAQRTYIYIYIYICAYIYIYIYINNNNDNNNNNNNNNVIINGNIKDVRAAADGAAGQRSPDGRRGWGCVFLSFRVLHLYFGVFFVLNKTHSPIIYFYVSLFLLLFINKRKHQLAVLWP